MLKKGTTVILEGRTETGLWGWISYQSVRRVSLNRVVHVFTWKRKKNFVSTTCLHNTRLFKNMWCLLVPKHTKICSQEQVMTCSSCHTNNTMPLEMCAGFHLFLCWITQCFIEWSEHSNILLMIFSFLFFIVILII